jgi:hypothetical protein
MEFLVWINKEAEEELKRHSKQEYYLAQIAMEVRRTINPKVSQRLQKFLLKFGIEKKIDVEAMTDEEYEEAKRIATANAKLYWKTLVGVK